jgi:NAD(P)H-flavin reductase
MMPEIVRVRDFQRDTHDTYTLTLDPPAGRQAYCFRPGQFNMLYAFGVGEVPISVSSDAATAETCKHTIRSVGSVTDALGKLQPGDALGLRGPFGSSWPVEAARQHDVVFVTGGIGLAPLRPAIYHVLRHRDDYGRLVLLHGSRTPGDLLYADELSAWQRRHDFQVLLAVDRADAPWHGTIGPVTMLFAEADFDPARAIGMMCGPEVMMRYTVYEFEKRGVPHGRLYVSLERNMQCAVGFCGHCQFGPHFVCMDGPVFRFDTVEKLFFVREA